MNERIVADMARRLQALEADNRRLNRYTESLERRLAGLYAPVSLGGNAQPRAAGAGLELTGNTLAAKAHTGITVDSNGIAVTVPTANDFTDALETKLNSLRITGVLNKTADYTVQAADMGKCIVFNGSNLTCTLPDIAGTLAADGVTPGLPLCLLNANATDLTVDGHGSDRVHGDATFILPGSNALRLIPVTDTAWAIENLWDSVSRSAHAFSVFATPDNNSATATGDRNPNTGGNSGINAVGILPYNHKSLDTGSLFDTATHKFTCPSNLAGKWQFEYAGYGKHPNWRIICIKESAAGGSFSQIGSTTQGGNIKGQTGYAIVELAVGEKMFVKQSTNGNTFYAAGYCTFGGFFLGR